MTNIFHERTLSNCLKQPTANHKEAWQTKENKNSIIPHPRVTQAEMTDMRKQHENHRKSPHRINIFYSLSSHFDCKITEKIGICLIILKNSVFLHHERANQLDRLGEGTGSNYCRVLSLAPISGVVLLSIFAGSDDGHLLLYIRLSKERSRQRQRELEEIFTQTTYTLYII